MRLLLKTLFLTIVLCTTKIVCAAPDITGSISPIDPRPPLSNEIEDYELKGIYKKHLSANNSKNHLRIGIGFLNGYLSEIGITKSLGVFCTKFSEKYSLEKEWEVGLNISTAQIIQLNFGLKSYLETFYSEKMFFKYGVLNSFNGSAELSSLINLKSISAFASIGLDNFYTSSNKYNVEGLLGYSLNGYQILLLFGTNWPL